MLILILNLAITALFLFLFFLKPFWFLLFDYKVYDLFFVLRGEKPASSEIVILAIDDRCLEKLGRWPWERKLLARLINKVSSLNPAVIGIDIVFSEPEKSDPFFAESISQAGNVILPVVMVYDKEDPEADKILIESALFIAEEDPSYSFLEVPSFKGALFPVLSLKEASAGLAHLNIFPDPDGVVRKEYLYLNYHGYLIPSFSLKIVSYYLGIPRQNLVVIPQKGILMGKRFIPTQKDGSILVHYYGSFQSFKHISVLDLLEDNVEKSLFENKIVLIGATAVGTYDLKVTPLSPALPGIEKHASVVASLIEGKNLLPVSNTYLVVSLLLTGFTSLLFAKLRAVFSLILLVFFSFFLFSFSFILFQKGLWFSPTYSFSLSVFQFLILVSFKFAFLEKEARFIRKVFSSYVTEKVMRELIKNPEMAKLGGERREITVLFSDIRGFTSLSEKMAPERVVEILNEYFSAITEVIFKWEGTLDKFIGDAVMAFWGAPLPQEDHAEKAILCAIEMIKTTRKLNETWQNKNWPPIRIGVGINSGEALVGNIGAEGKKKEYTVIGDTVNLASRLEGLNKQYNSEIIFSEYTLKKLKKDFLKNLKEKAKLLYLDEVKVKGKEVPVKIYKLEVKT